MTQPAQPNQVATARPALYRADRVTEFTTLTAQMLQLAQPPKGAISVYDNDGQKRLFEMAGNVAVIQVSGVLLANFPYIGWSFATGYDALYCQIAQAFMDPEVKAIVLLIDSGGGEVADCFDLVDWIMAAKAAAKKPIAAILAESAYSAAYALASTADSIAVPRTGGVGSVGVVMAHVDMSGWLKQIGVDVTLIHAGEHKVDGNTYQPLPGDVRDRWQAGCEDVRQLFCETVARNRSAAGVKLSAKDLLATEAAIYEGPSGLANAIKLGLADEIMPWRTAINRVIAEVAGA